jgi:hypothetical protein
VLLNPKSIIYIYIYIFTPFYKRRGVTKFEEMCYRLTKTTGHRLRKARLGFDVIHGEL